MGKDNDTESSKKKKQASNSTSTTPVKEEDIYKVRQRYMIDDCKQTTFFHLFVIFMK